jgi:hypothetical protein
MSKPPALFNMIVFHDAVKLETEDCGRKMIVGWFRDEVSAIGAAAERTLMRSAILSTLRKLPELVITSEYKPEFAKRGLTEFRRATRMKIKDGERRVVMRPGMFGRTWI